MTSESLFVLLSVNVAVACAVAILLAVRGPMRRLCGPDVAYGLWILVSWFGFAQLVASLGAREVGVLDISTDLARALTIAWILGIAAHVAAMALAQNRVLRRARSGRMGPAVVGILAPRVFLPRDFETRYTPGEQAVIRAHERAHLLRHDVLANAALALGRCLLWFNPFLHLAAVFMRQDQEMACDATVLQERPEQRRRYAAALLKAQMVSNRGLATACAWIGGHPLEARIRTVAQGMPNTYLRVTATLSLAAVSITLLLNFTDDADRVFRAIAQVQFLAQPV